MHHYVVERSGKRHREWFHGMLGGLGNQSDITGININDAMFEKRMMSSNNFGH